MTTNAYSVPVRGDIIMRRHAERRDWICLYVETARGGPGAGGRGYMSTTDIMRAREVAERLAKENGVDVYDMTDDEQ